MSFTQSNTFLLLSLLQAVSMASAAPHRSTRRANNVTSVVDSPSGSNETLPASWTEWNATLPIPSNTSIVGSGNFTFTPQNITISGNGTEIVNINGTVVTFSNLTGTLVIPLPVETSSAVGEKAPSSTTDGWAAPTSTDAWAAPTSTEAWSAPSATGNASWYDPAVSTAIWDAPESTGEEELAPETIYESAPTETVYESAPTETIYEPVPTTIYQPTTKIQWETDVVTETQAVTQTTTQTPSLPTLTVVLTPEEQLGGSYNYSIVSPNAPISSGSSSAPTTTVSTSAPVSTVSAFVSTVSGSALPYPVIPTLTNEALVSSLLPTSTPSITYSIPGVNTVVIGSTSAAPSPSASPSLVLPSWAEGWNASSIGNFSALSNSTSEWNASLPLFNASLPLFNGSMPLVNYTTLAANWSVAFNGSDVPSWSPAKRSSPWAKSNRALKM